MDFLFIKIKKGHWARIMFKEINYIKPDSDYADIFTTIRPLPFTTHRRMRYMENFLPKPQFKRIHQSYIVNTEHLSPPTLKKLTSKKYKNHENKKTEETNQRT